MVMDYVDAVEWPKTNLLKIWRKMLTAVAAIHAKGKAAKMCYNCAFCFKLKFLFLTFLFFKLCWLRFNLSQLVAQCFEENFALEKKLVWRFIKKIYYLSSSL